MTKQLRLDAFQPTLRRKQIFLVQLTPPVSIWVSLSHLQSRHLSSNVARLKKARMSMFESDDEDDQEASFNGRLSRFKKPAAPKKSLFFTTRVFVLVRFWFTSRTIDNKPEFRLRLRADWRLWHRASVDKLRSRFLGCRFSERLWLRFRIGDLRCSQS